MSVRPADSATPKGEPWVWFTSLGLIVGLAMVAGLLGLVVVNGVSVFWAPEVPTVRLIDGTTLVGQLAQRRIRPGSPAAEPRFERQYQVGLREVNGASYVWVDEQKIAGETREPGLLGLERMENGPAFVSPVALVDAQGRRVSAADAGFFAALQGEIDRAAEVRGRLTEINRQRIGEVNAEMESLRISQRRAEDHREPTQAIVARMGELDRRFAELKEQAAKVAAGGSTARLEARDGSGRALALPAASLVRAWEPNRMGVGQRLGLFFGRLREFLFDEPREANTEGGLMPAIFGTLVMTVFMSLLVTPFGVIAAIYLREYAKDGPVLRAVRICVNNLAGVPSIVFGVFGLGFFVYVLGGSLDRLFFADQLKYNNNTPVLGTGGLLWCSLTLALMTLPVVIVATEEALSAVPRGMREASLAAGASKWQTIRDILLPASAPGILTGVILAMARGAGEVAPLMLVGVVKLAPTLPVDGLAPFLHLDRKFMHLGFHIFDLGFQSPDSDAARPMVFATTLLLIVLVVCLNLGAITIRNRLRARFKGASF
jgi:phosphate transport system permease protein